MAKSDLEIAHQAPLTPIYPFAEKVGISEKFVEPYGKYKAKVCPKILSELEERPDGKLVVVTAITPTPLGEGKTVTTIGSSLGLAAIGKSVFTCIRQPSMGPIFGIKGGAAGGGYSQVIPMEDFNLHLTGDIHAISAAHNLGAAALDSRLYHEQRKGYENFEKRTGMKALRIDPDHIPWRRVVDINDRALRQIDIGLAHESASTNDNGIPRRSGFDISVASELMAILALSEDLHDMRTRIGRVEMAKNEAGDYITAEDLGVAGAMTVVMKEAIKPTLMQTTEQTPCFVHAGPFANIAHGNSSIIADKIALKLADYVITEAGFGSDMGFEKFVNIKTRVSGKQPSAAVLVATLRALKMHSGKYSITPGKPLDKGLIEKNLEALEEGLANLQVHIENVLQTGVPVVVALNRFPGDTTEELNFVRKKAVAFGACDAVISDVHAQGGEGGRELAQAIVHACATENKMELLYEDALPLLQKIEKIAKTLYRADSVNFSETAQKQLQEFEDAGYGHFPVCMAKTPLSLSHDPSRKGAPSGFDFPVKKAYLSAGAGFIYVLAEQIRTMPGFGSLPSYPKIDIDEKGAIIGLF